MLTVLALSVFFINCSKDTDLYDELGKYEDLPDVSVGEEDSTNDPAEDSDTGTGSEEDLDNPSLGDEENLPEPDFTYTSFQASYGESSLWYDQAVIEIGGAQGGIFVYEATSSKQNDGGLVFEVPNRSGKLARYWNNDGTVRAEWFGLIPNDENFDNKQPFESMLNAKASGISSFTTVLFTGEYNFSSVVNIPSLNNLSFRSLDAVNRATFHSKNLYTLFTSGYNGKVDNFSMYNIKTSSELSDHLNETVGNSATLWAFGEGGGVNHYFENCEFTAPNAYTNGFKYYANDTDDYNGIVFKDCWFHDIGRFAIEIFGTRYGSIYNYQPEQHANIKHVVFDGGTCERTGTMGQLGISIVQSIYDVTIKNMTLRDNNSSLELGATNVKVHGNTFEGKDNTMSFGGIYDDSSNPLYYQTDYEIFNNTSNTSGGMSFIAVENISFHDNDWTFGSSLYFNNANNISFDSESIKVNGYTSWGGGTTIPTLQFFNKVHSLSFENVEYEFLNSTTFSTNSSAVSISNSVIYVKDHLNFTLDSALNMTNVSKYVNGVMSSILHK